MRLPEVLPTVRDGRRETHMLDVPPCCPVSKNPRPGSQLMIVYSPQGAVLEVGALYAYLHQYRGGLRNEQGDILVRDMEGLISRVAQDCANAVGVPVSVCADLIIAPKQRMLVFVRKTPIMCHVNC